VVAGRPGGRALALRGVPVPVLRVRDRVDERGRTSIHAADDGDGRTPLLWARAKAVDGEADPVHGAAEPEEAAPDTRLHEAVLYGAPYEGGELVLGTTDREGHPAVVRATGAVRVAPSGQRPAHDCRPNVGDRTPTRP
jgi:hypothetical protein